jgi:hypothetical protein
VKHAIWAFLAASALASVGCSQQQATIAVPGPVKEAVLSQHAGFRQFEPGPEAVDVPDSRIPGEVKETAQEWLKRVIRPEYLPEDPVALMKGMTWRVDYIPPQNVDFLVLEYARGKSAFRIAEAPGNVSVLWVDADIAAGEDPANAAIDLAKKLLAIPEDRQADLRANLKELPAGDQKVFAGYLSIPKPR